MESAIQKFFHIANYTMHQRQPLRRFFHRQYLFLLVMHFVDRIKRWKCICADNLTRFQVILKKLAYRFLRNHIDCFCCHETGLFSSCFYCYQNWPFTGSASATLASPFTATICIIKLNQVLKSIITVSIGHSCTNFLQYAPSRHPGYANMFGKPECRDSSLVSGCQINRPEPSYQWKVRRMKQGAGCYRCLISALRTLIYFTGFYIRCICRATSWTDKPLWPSNFKQNSFTSSFSAVLSIPGDSATLFRSISPPHSEASRHPQSG
jgi:hypothetical protein